MCKMYNLPLAWCLLSAAVFANASDKTTSKKDNVITASDLGEIHNMMTPGNQQSDEEIRAAFPIMSAFKTHSLFTANDLKDKREYENEEQDNIEIAVQDALTKLHKKKAIYEQAVDATEQKAPEQVKTNNETKNVTAKELIDEVVKEEMKKRGVKQSAKTSEASSDEPLADVSPESRSTFENQIHRKLSEITHLEKKLFHLVREVKGYLQKKKATTSEGEKTGKIEDDDDVDSILANSDKKKRTGIPHTAVLEKFRNNPALVDKYIDNILNDDNTANGDQRDLLGKEDTQTALLRDAVPGEINSIPLSRIDKESDDYESMTTDRGIARDAMVESPFSMLDVHKTTGKKFRHNVS